MRARDAADAKRRKIEARRVFYDQKASDWWRVDRNGAQNLQVPISGGLSSAESNESAAQLTDAVQSSNKTESSTEDTTASSSVLAGLLASQLAIRRDGWKVRDSKEMLLHSDRFILTSRDGQEMTLYRGLMSFDDSEFDDKPDCRWKPAHRKNDDKGS